LLLLLLLLPRLLACLLAAAAAAAAAAACLLLPLLLLPAREMAQLRQKSQFFGQAHPQACFQKLLKNSFKIDRMLF
jgi:hypothetical protein